jgi:phospholipid/cholesterol/gamma-HCH transport system substrate-binding protein
MKKSYLELWVGLFLALGTLCLGWLSVGIASRDFVHLRGYEVQAVFTRCNGLRARSPVVIAGVEVGWVRKIVLRDYEAKVVMLIQPGVVLQQDVIASIKTEGLIGEKYIELTPGAAVETIPAGGLIRNTEPAMDLEELIGKMVHGTVSAPAR